MPLTYLYIFKTIHLITCACLNSSHPGKKKKLHKIYKVFDNNYWYYDSKILLISLFVKFNYLQMLPATAWRKLYVSIKISLKTTFQFNEVLSAFVQCLNDFPSRHICKFG